MRYRSRQEYINAIRPIVLEISRTNCWERLDEVGNLIWEWNSEHPHEEIFFGEADQYLALEDEMFDIVSDEEIA